MSLNKLSNTNSIFEYDWWLNAITPNDWERLILKDKNDGIIASFPIVKSKCMGFKMLSTPIFTQTLGIYIKDTGAKLSKRLEKEKKSINNIIDLLPKGYNYDFYLDSDNSYVLPFIWNGFKVEPKFSYRLDDLSDLDKIWSGFKENIKTDIRKAKKKVNVKFDGDISVILDMQKMTYARQNRKLPYDADILIQLDNDLKEHNARKIIYAEDEAGNIHAATYFIFDERRCYYLISGGNPDYRNSGATSLLVWEGIKFAAMTSEIFDFEGSMIEDIERFVRGFGATPHVYYRVKKVNWVLSFADYIKPKIKKLLRYKQ